MRSTAALLASLLLAACATGEAGDAGGGRIRDGGPMPVDTGSADGASPDAGGMDASPSDAGPADVGPRDAGPGCVPRMEICNGVDDDCNGFADDGLTRPCSSACGAGVETCSAGTFGGCTAPSPAAETCDGSDEDCDGRVDEDLTRACSTACGAGIETCQAGAFTGCTARVPTAETCDGSDQDCDGSTDEDLHVDVLDGVPMSELTAAQPPCDGPDASIDVCMSAASRYCAARPFGCYVSGAGHLEATATSARVACFGKEATRMDVTRATISAASGITLSDLNIRLRVAQSAVNRYCRSIGFEAGVGPVEHSDPQVHVVCLPSSAAAYRSIPTTELTSRGCEPVSTDPSTLVCSSASDAHCRANGFAGGIGPVEWNATDSAVVCFRE